MIDLLKNLREEHQYILKLLEQEDKIFQAIEFIETVHHEKEEEILFPFVAQQPWLSEGGPLCTYFRGLQLDLRYQDAIKEQLNRYHAIEGILHLKPPRPLWLSDQSPLSLPMEEHELAHELSSALRSLNEKKNSKLYLEFFGDFRQLYIQLLKVHIAKEDNCFFVMCETRLR